jgi:hemoglobin
MENFRMIKSLLPYVALLLLLAAQNGVAQSTTPLAARQAAMVASAPRDPSLRSVFAQFGGKAGLVALMDDFMDDLMADRRTRPYFANVDRERVKAQLVDQICVILDGPCRYRGKDMEQVHRKLGIDQAAFYALIEDLQRAMDRHKVPFRAQNKLLAKLAPMQKAVITR